MVNVVAETGDKESEDLRGGEEGELVAMVVQQVAEVGDGDSVEPVVVGGVTIPLLHHQQKPEEGQHLKLVGHQLDFGDVMHSSTSRASA